MGLIHDYEEGKQEAHVFVTTLPNAVEHVRKINGPD